MVNDFTILVKIKHYARVKHYVYNCVTLYSYVTTMSLIRLAGSLAPERGEGREEGE